MSSGENSTEHINKKDKAMFLKTGLDQVVLPVEPSTSHVFNSVHNLNHS